MLLTITRERGYLDKPFTPGCIDIDGKFMGFTLEDQDLLEAGKEKVAGKTCIGCGSFDVDITYSNRFKRRMILIKDVPLFTGVRFHGGNKAEDTEGCPMGGAKRSADHSTIGECAPVVDAIFAAVDDALGRGEPVRITVKYGPMRTGINDGPPGSIVGVS